MGDNLLAQHNAEQHNAEDVNDVEGLPTVVSVDELTILFDELPPGIYRYAGRVGNTALLRWAQARGWGAWQINGTNIRCKADFLSAIKRAMHLPSWFGRNWDALDETLRDLEGQRASGYLLLYDYPAPLAEGDPAAWQSALEILRDASTFWQAQGQPFYVVLRHTHGVAPDLPLLR
jgi:hypothetical protein